MTASLQPTSRLFLGGVAAILTVSLAELGTNSDPGGFMTPTPGTQAGAIAGFRTASPGADGSGVLPASGGDDLRTSWDTSALPAGDLSKSGVKAVENGLTGVAENLSPTETRH